MAATPGAAGRAAAKLTPAERVAALLQRERRLWRRGQKLVAGVDEAGRGPLAGPVVAAAVVIRPFFRGRQTERWFGIDDSKKLTEAARQRCYERIVAEALAVGIGVVDAETIDRLNIYQATVAAMEAAVAEVAAQLGQQPDYILTDAVPLRRLSVPQAALAGGDRLSLSVAAASIVAKVHRDRLMLELDAQYPAYGFARHKGYPTKEHRQALQQHGPCPAHRRSFRWDGGEAGRTAAGGAPTAGGADMA